LATIEMKEAQKNVGEYLAAIGKRGGLAEPPRVDALACKTNGCDPRSQTRGTEKGKPWPPRDRKLLKLR
jgi:hypothetical protein